MYFDNKTESYILIGTVFGNGYDCAQNKLHRYEGSRDGLWNKVSKWVNWIKTELTYNLGEEICPRK